MRLSRAFGIVFASCLFLSDSTLSVYAKEVIIKDKAGRLLELYKESHALVIGVSEYVAGWPSLPGVKADIQAVAAALKQQGFQVEVVENPDQAGLEKAYKDFIFTFGLNPESRLLFYYAGHGFTHKPSYAANDPEEWMGYIVPREAPLPTKDLPRFLHSAMSMQQFENLALTIEAKHAIFIFDSCFSGSIFALSRAAPTDINALTARPVRQFLSSGSADQQVPDVSLFRKQFVAALNGEADLNHDGYVTGSELGSFLQEKITNYSHGVQTPQYGKIRHPRLDRGDIVFPVEEAKSETPPLLPAPPPLTLQGHLQVNVNADDARVRINGTYVGTAKRRAPLALQNLDAGAVRVLVEAEGYEPIERSVDIAVNQWTQEAFLLKPRAMAEVPVSPAPVKQRETPSLAEAVSPRQSDPQASQQSSGSEQRLTLASPKTETPPSANVLPSPPTMQGVVVNSSGMEFVLIPAGEFLMGAEGDSSLGPVHKVTISQPFYLGKYEVTQAQWEAVMRRNPSRFTGDPQRPIERVSWREVQEFIAALNEKEGGPRYRLPTEAEWEYAARAGGTGRYGARDDAEELGEFAWFEDNAGRKTHPVGQLKPNAWGLYDMLGNVWEWCQDWYERSYASAAVQDPQGPSGGRFHVYRGCGWYRGGSRSYCEIATRHAAPPDFTHASIGFRLVMKAANMEQGNRLSH